MIFQLCDGDITKRKGLRGVSYYDAMKWFYLNAFRNKAMKDG